MTRGRPLAYLVAAGLLFVGCVGMLSVRELLATWLVLGIVSAVLVVVVVLFWLARQKRLPRR